MRFSSELTLSPTLTLQVSGYAEPAQAWGIEQEPLEESFEPDTLTIQKGSLLDFAYWMEGKTVEDITALVSKSINQ